MLCQTCEANLGKESWLREINLAKVFKDPTKIFTRDAYPYSCLVSFFKVFQVVARDLNSPFASSPQSPFQSESECKILVLLCSLVVFSRRMKTDTHNKNVLHRLSLKVRL